MKAIILSGGKGERLRPFTESCPKSMIEVDGKPIIHYQIEWLKKYGVDEIVFACGYLNEKIKDYFGDGKRLGIKADYSVEEKPLGRGGAIKKAWGKFPGERVIVTNGDIFTDLNLNDVLENHINKKEKNGILATICLFPFKSPYGVVRVGEDGIVQDFEEKRKLPYWINGGIYIFEPEVRNFLPDIGDHETTTFQDFATKKLIYGYKSESYWKGIDTVKDLNDFMSDKKYKSA